MPKLRKRDIPSFPHKDSVQILKKQKQAKDSAADEDDMKSHPSVNDFLDWYLDGHDRKSLNKLVKNELLDMCKGRGIEHEGLKTKAAMIDELLRWKKFALPPGTSNLKATLGSIPDLTMPNGPLSMSAADLAGSNSSVASDNESGPKISSMPVSVDPQVQELRNSALFAAPELAHVDSSSAETITDQSTDILVQDIQIEEHLAKGGFKDVYRAKWRGEEVAVGIIDTQKLADDDLSDIEKELNLLKQLRHDNIVNFMGMSKLMGYPKTSDKDKKKQKLKCQKVYILTEFCPFGDLSDYMQSRKRPSLKRQVELMYDIAFGVSYLHHRRPDVIIHRDLKSTNILIDKDERAKIADFGLAKIKNKARKLLMHSVVGTLNWQAPEMWKNQPSYTESVDIYSCGLIFWEILQWGNVYPFDGLNDFQIYEKVGKKNLRPSIDEIKAPKELLDLIESMWQADPKKRPNIGNVIQVLNGLIEK